MADPKPDLKRMQLDDALKAFPSPTRQCYLGALQAADAKDYSALLDFVCL
jgi:hypothetical protein